MFEEKYTLEEWRKRYRVGKKACEYIEAQQTKKAKRLCKEAGLDPKLLGIHPHNAMVSLHCGQPWENVDYQKVRECLYVMKHRWDARRLLDAWDKRVRIHYAPR